MCKKEKRKEKKRKTETKQEKALFNIMKETKQNKERIVV
jgi:hypothetical protein